MTLSISACVSNSQDVSDAAAAQASGYASGNADGQAAAQANAIKAAGVITAMYNDLGSTNNNFQLVKFGNDDANFAVISYVNLGNTAYAAVDLRQFTLGSSWNAFAAANPTAVMTGLTNNGDGTFSCNAGSCYNGYGATSSSMIFEKTAGTTKDLDKAAALVEAYKVDTTASNIASEFGLTAERSIQVAKLASAWSKLSKSRALTSADADAFTQEAVGVNLAEINNAGNSPEAMSSLIEKAAERNETTSENMTLIMTKLFL